MRKRKLVGILSALALALVAVLWFLARRPAPKPTLSIGGISYGSRHTWAFTSPSISVRLGIANTGRTTVRYNEIGFSGCALSVESEKGWEIREIRPFDGARLRSFVSLLGTNSPRTIGISPYLLLPPGSNTTVSIEIPLDTGRWQIAYRVRTASLKERILATIPTNWRSRVGPLCERIFSSRQGPEQEVVSELFEVPYPIRTSTDEPAAYDAADFWSPAPIRRKRE